VLTEEWLTGWAAQVDASVARALRDVVSTYGFEAGEHHVGPPSSAADLAAVRDRMPWVPDELLALFRFVGPVSLPDITNGYFLHLPASVIGHLDHDGGRADRIGEPLTEDVDIVVFGSNGGGDLYAVVVTDSGPVYRLQDAGYEAGTYRRTERGIKIVGENLRDFLEKLRAAVEAFAEDGRIADL
jgi:hypothetical protein